MAQRPKGDKWQDGDDADHLASPSAEDAARASVEVASEWTSAADPAVSAYVVQQVKE